MMFSQNHCKLLEKRTNRGGNDNRKLYEDFCEWDTLEECNPNLILIYNLLFEDNFTLHVLFFWDNTTCNSKK